MPQARGAHPRRIQVGVFARAASQVGGGVLAGPTLTAPMDRAGGTGVLSGKGVLRLATVAAMRFPAPHDSVSSRRALEVTRLLW